MIYLPLHDVQLKVSTGTETFTAALMNKDGRPMLFDGTNTTGTITVTTTWTSFKDLWMTATGKSENDWIEEYRNKAVDGIYPVQLSALTVPIQVRVTSLVDRAITTYTNGDWFWLGYPPAWVLPNFKKKSEGQVIGVAGRTISQALVTDAALHAAGDVVVANVAVTGLMRGADKQAYLSSFVLRELDNSATISAADLWVYFFKVSTSMGAANAAFAPSDASIQSLMHSFRIASTEWVGLGANGRAVTIPLSDTRMGALLTPLTETADVYMCMETDGTPTPGSTAALHSSVSVIDA